MADNIEGVSELNDRIAELNDTLSNFSSSMQSQMRSTNQALGQNTTLVNQNNAAVAGSTKLSQIEEQVSNQLAKARAEREANYSKALNATTNSVTNFAKAMVSTQEGFGKYGSALSSAGDAVFNFGKSFGIVGTVLGGLVKGVSMFAGEALKMHDNMIQLNRSITKFAGVLPSTNNHIADLSARAGYAGEKMAQLGKITESIGQNLVSLGVTAGRGAERFLQVADVGDRVKMQFSKLGVSQEDLTAMQAEYIKLQGMSGQAYRLQNMDMRQLREQSTAYAENLVKMSAITGKTAEEQQRREEIMRSQYEERSQIVNDENKARQLEKEGRLDEARELRANTKVRQGVGDVLAKTVGTETAAMITRVMRVGSFDNVTKGLAASGWTVERIKELQQAGMDAYVAAGSDAKKQQDAANSAGIATLDEYKKIATGVNSSIGTALQYGGEELGKKFALTGEGLGYLADTAGMTAKETYDAAGKDLAAKKTAADAAATAQADLEAQERETRKEYQEHMLALARTIIPGVITALQLANTTIDLFDAKLKESMALWDKWGETIKTGILVLGGVWAAFKGFSIIKGVWTAFGVLRGALSGFAGWVSKLFGGAAAGGAEAVAAGGAEAAAAGGAAMLATSLLAGGAVAGGLGYLGNKGVDYAKDKGLVGQQGGAWAKLLADAGAGAAGGAAVGAVGGAGIGAVPGAVVGGLLGGAYGLYDNWSDLWGGKSTSKSSTDESEAKHTKETVIKTSDTNAKAADSNAASTVTQTKNTASQSTFVTLFGKNVSSFGSIIASEGKIVAAFGTMVKSFIESVTLFSDTITTFGDTFNMNGSTAGATTGGVDPKTIQQATSFLTGKGWTPAQAAGIVGNLVTESKLKTDAVGDNGKAYGIAQWHPDRQAKFKQVMGRDIRGSRLEDQLAFLDWELRHTESAAGNALARTTTAAAAASIFDRKYERSSGAAIQERMANANAIASGNLSGSSNQSIVDLGNSLLAQGFKVTENNNFGGVTPGVHKGRGHKEGRAIDINLVSGRDADDPIAGPRMDALAAQLSGNPNFTVLWKTKDHYDHMHVESKLRAARGGVFSGPRSGYPIEMHGTEMVAPLNVDSILMKLAKAPAGSAEAEAAINSISQTGSGKSTADVEKIVAVQSRMIELLGNKMDTVIAVLESGNHTQTKILRHSMA